MLLLIGLGLEVKDISVRALEALQRVDRIFAEQYTTIIPKKYLDYLEKTTGKKITPLKRSDLEEDVKRIIGAAKEKDIALLMPGDPLVATTHHTIIDAARRQGIGTKVFHSSSIFPAAIGLSGLDLYRFGPSTTIPFWSDRYKPTSFLDVIKRNLDSNEHTLILLDIDSKNSRHMSVQEAVGLLLEAEREKGLKIFSEKTKIIVMEDVGRGGQRISYDSLAGIKASKAAKGAATVLIMPAALNFAEEDALKAATSSSS